MSWQFITPINPGQIKTAIQTLLKKGMQSLAVVGVFSSLNASHEKLVKEIAQNMTKDTLPVSISSSLGAWDLSKERTPLF